MPSLMRSLSCVSSKSSKIKRKEVLEETKPIELKDQENKDEKNQEEKETLPESVLNTPSSLLRENRPFSFWQIGNYKKTIERCENGQKLAIHLADMIGQRAELENNYAKSLKNWHKKWNEYLNSSEFTEYGTGVEGWRGFLETGNRTADIHTDMAKSLINRYGPVDKIKDWLRKNYEKHMFKSKKIKELEVEFEMAEKSWVDLNEKLKKAKREYYECIKIAQQCELGARSAQSNPKIKQDQREKLIDKAKRAEYEQEKAKDRYTNAVKETELYQNLHVEKMSRVFNKAQMFERERMEFVKNVFLECNDLIRTHRDERFDKIFEDYLNSVSKIDHERDLSWWSKQYGADTDKNWPSFEQFQGK